MSFQSLHSFEKRKSEGIRIRAKYPDRIPVIVERSANSQLAEVDKKKYLLPQDLTVGQFLYVIRKRIKLPPDQAIFLFVNNTLPAPTATISQIYQQFVDPDQFLYFTYQGESVFG